MKYKKHVATGALALSLLVGGSSVLAATPRDLGIKNIQATYQKHNKEKDVLKVNKQNNAVGTVSALNASGFTLDVKNMKTSTTTSLDVKTDSNTLYTKDGKSALFSDLVVGQKVIVKGLLDKTTNVFLAKKVKLVTNIVKTNNLHKLGNKTKENKTTTTATN